MLDITEDIVTEVFGNLTRKHINLKKHRFMLTVLYYTW
jgi:hypothetical protein